MSELNLVLLGPPGSGKGTQGERLQEDLEVPYYATGDILRAAVREETELGRTAREYMDRGDLVPDDVIVAVIVERIARSEADDGFILDGFPRTLVQAERLDGIVGNGGDSLRVLQLLVPDEAIVRRVTLRRTCPQCGAIYHLENNPPASDAVCDRCGAEVVARTDDTEDKVRRRLDEYHAQTVPVATFYRTKSVLREVDGIGPVDEVFERIERSLS